MPGLALRCTHSKFCCCCRDTIAVGSVPSATVQQYQMGDTHHHHRHQMLGPSACQSPSQSRHLSAACHLVPKAPLSGIGRQMQNAVFCLGLTRVYDGHPRLNILQHLWHPKCIKVLIFPLLPSILATICREVCYLLPTASSLGKIWLRGFWVGEQGAHSNHRLHSPAAGFSLQIASQIVVKTSQQVIGGVLMRAPKLAASWLQSQ